jgi:oligoribonuclease (3'-5' exoribonuclease)
LEYFSSDIVRFTLLTKQRKPSSHFFFVIPQKIFFKEQNFLFFFLVPNKDKMATRQAKKKEKIETKETKEEEQKGSSSMSSTKDPTLLLFVRFKMTKMEVKMEDSDNNIDINNPDINDVDIGLYEDEKDDNKSEAVAKTDEKNHEEEDKENDEEDDNNDHKNSCSLPLEATFGSLPLEATFVVYDLTKQQVLMEYHCFFSDCWSLAQEDEKYWDKKSLHQCVTSKFAFMYRPYKSLKKIQHEVTAQLESILEKYPHKKQSKNGKASFLLCASNVGQQKLLLQRYFPNLNHYLHFRTFDLCDVTLFFNWFQPDLANEEMAVQRKIPLMDRGLSTIQVFGDVLLFQTYFKHLLATKLSMKNLEKISSFRDVTMKNLEKISSFHDVTKEDLEDKTSSYWAENKKTKELVPIISSTSTSTKKRDYVLAWCDVEATNAHPLKSTMLEVAFCIVDVAGKITPRKYHSIIHSSSPTIEKTLSEWSRVTHDQSKLLDQVEKSSHTLLQVEMELCEFISKSLRELDANRIIICGSHTSFDRECLLHNMPKLKQFCHDITFDVSILLMFFSWTQPELWKYKPKRSSVRHRAQVDIEDSLRLFRFYQRFIQTPVTIT